MTVGPCAEEADLTRFGEIASEAFAVPVEDNQPYFESVGVENVRLVRRGKHVVGGLAGIPKGQWFGGRAVPMNGVAAVAVAPYERARGAATTLLREFLKELRERGTPISSLYPATRRLYRRVGYEMAGDETEVTLPLKSIDLRDRELELRPMTDSDDDAVRAVYANWAARNPGNLDRVAFNWRRVRQFRKQPTHGYVVCRDGALEGYAYVRSITREGEPALLYTHDVVAATPAAARRLLTFLADFRTVRKEVKWRTNSTDTLLMTLTEGDYTLQHVGSWMLRIVDVAKALEARGYPPGMQAEVHFNVHDDLLPANNGKFVLEVGDAVGHVKSGGRGTFELDIRGLATLYSGYMTPDTIAAIKLGTAPEAELAQAGAVFAGPRPWMRDAF
ncbi:MAG: GNAT family N-acetyltransferase [Phycisphaerae bacterium]|nr:GNAT family N-acetyltransferase [Phycisphaerae bacterium]